MLQSKMNTVYQSVKSTERSVARLRSSVPPLSTMQTYQSPATQHVVAIPPSQACAGQTGACAVCERDGLHIINTTGLLRNHGPRGNLCTGSHSRPVLGSVKYVSSRLANTQLLQQNGSSQLDITNNRPAAETVNMITSPTIMSSAVSTPSDVVIMHPVHNSQILKRIPKGARVAVANVLLS